MAMSVPIFIIYGFGIFIDPLAEALQTGRGEISLALTIGIMGNLAAGPVIGMLSDRYGARRMILIGVIALSLILASFSLVQTVAQLYMVSLAMVLLGAGTGPITYTRIIAAWFNKRRGLALGIALTGIGIGGALVPIVGQSLITGFGWRVAYQYLAVMVFLVSFPLLFFVLRDRPPVSTENSDPEAPSSSENPVEEGLSVRDAIRQKRFWFLAIGFLFIAIGNSGVLVHLPPLLTDAGLTPEKAALYAGVMGVGVTFGRAIAGYLLDIYHAPYVAIFFLIGPFLAFSFFLAGVDPNWAFIPTLLFGIGMGAEFDVIPYLVTRYFGLKNFGMIYGIQISTFSVGTGLGAAVMGFGYDKFGSYDPTLIVAMSVLLIGCAFIVRLGSYRFT
jgi:MFS family permease